MRGLLIDRRLDQPLAMDFSVVAFSAGPLLPTVKPQKALQISPRPPDTAFFPPPLSPPWLTSARYV